MWLHLFFGGVSKMNKDEIGKFIDEKFPPDSWLWSRLWDDDCICPNIETVDPKCPNKRCRESAK